MYGSFNGYNGHAIKVFSCPKTAVRVLQRMSTAVTVNRTRHGAARCVSNHAALQTSDSGGSCGSANTVSEWMMMS